MIEAELPDGTILEFPDGTTPDVMRAAVQRMQKPQGATFGSMMKDELLRPVRAVRDLAAGAVRGAGSIGATLLAPRDAAESFIARQMGAPELQAPERRNAMSDALRSMGADTDSMAFGAGKIGAEIAGTAGVGGALAGGAQGMGAAPAVVNALRTGGMTTGGRGAADLALRAGAGAAVGGASAGLVDPSQAGTGALIGGALPGAISGAGKVGAAVGGAIYRAMTPEMQKQAVALAQATGRTIDEVASALQQRGPTMIPGSAKTTPQILQNETVSQVARNLQNKGNFGLVEAERANAAARIAALERVAPTAGTINEARANAGNAIERFARPAEAAQSLKVRNLFDAVPDDEVAMHLPLDQMQDAMAKYLGRGTFGKGGATAEQAIQTARGIGTEALDAVKAAPVQKQQSLYDAVLSAGGIHKNSPSGRQLLGELKDLAASKQGSAVRANSGKSADLLAQEMYARGFIPDEDPATLIQYLKDAGRDTFAADASVAGQYARRAESAMGDLPQAKVISKIVPFSEIQNLRSSIGEAIADAKKNERTQAAAALTAMKKSIDEKVDLVSRGGGQPDEMFSPEAIKIWRKALDAHAAKKAQFNIGPQASMFRMGQDGLPVKEGAEVAPLFWNSGNAQIENMQAFKRLTKEDQGLVRLMKSNATTEALQSSAKGPQGAMTFDAFNKWMKTHAGAAKELFSDQELATLKAIGDELRTATKAENLGRATGSNTAQNIMSGGILGNPRAQAIAQSLPMGVGNFVTGPLFNYARTSGETARNAALAQLLADPELMGQQLRMYSQGRAPSALIETLKNPQLQQMLQRSAPVISAQ